MAFTTPSLPYEYNALEPHIDEQTMRLHHDKHHVGYTTKVNAAIDGTDYADWTITRLLRELGSLPEGIRAAVRNNGGGHANHALFWTAMSPAGGGEPSGALAKALAQAFGGYEQFVRQFSSAATGQFGSGWAWLVTDSSGGLVIYPTANQDSPITNGDIPLLGIDVWEHAYYLKYQNRRPEYVTAFFNIINWRQVDANMEASRHG